MILEKEPNLNHVDRFERTPLHHACNAGNFEAVKCLLEQRQNKKGQINVNA